MTARVVLPRLPLLDAPSPTCSSRHWPALRQALSLAQAAEDVANVAAELYPDAEAVAAELVPCDVAALEAERYRGPLRLGGYREGRCR